MSLDRHWDWAAEYDGFQTFCGRCEYSVLFQYHSCDSSFVTRVTSRSVNKSDRFDSIFLIIINYHVSCGGAAILVLVLKLKQFGRNFVCSCFVQEIYVFMEIFVLMVISFLLLSTLFYKCKYDHTVY